MIDLSISIVSHGHGSLVANLLSDLDRDPELKGATVVLTLNIPEAPFQPLDYPNLDLQIIENARPKGFGANHNTAFKQCRTRWFLILNPDIAIQEPFARRLITSAAELDHVGMIAPNVIGRDGRPQDSVRTLVTPWSIASRVLLRRRKAISPPPAWQLSEQFYWLAGMFLIVNSDAFRAIGGFDERIFLYYEDFDLSARLYLAGYRLAFDQDVNVIHEAQRSSHRSLRYLRWHITSLIRLWVTPPFWRILLRLNRLGGDRRQIRRSLRL